MFSSITSRLIFWIAGTTALLLASGRYYSYSVERDQAIQEAERRAVLLAEFRASQVGDALRSAEEGALLLATTLGHTKASNEELAKVIRAFVEGNPRVYGSTIAVNPEGRGLFAPYFHRQSGAILRADLATPTYDYLNKEWYTGAVKAGEPRWSPPYFDDGGGNVLMVTYTVPVTTETSRGRTLVGVVTADVALEWLAELTKSMGAQDSSYAMVLSQRGEVLAHPDAGKIMRPSPLAAQIAEHTLRGGPGLISFEDTFLGQRARAVFRPVGGAGWSIAVIYPEETFLAGARRFARLNGTVLVTALVILGFLVVIVSRRITRPLRELAASAAQLATGDFDAALPPVASKDEVGALTGAFHHMRDSLREYMRNLEITTKEKERQDSELEIARKIQMNMLPSDHVSAGPSVPYELAARLVPARRVGGDFYDHFVLDGKLWFMVGDVSGKGVGAALFMARAITLLRTVAHSGVALKEVLRAVNLGLCAQNDQAMFVTLFAGVLDFSTGRLTYGSAGHDPPVFLDGGSSEVSLMVSEGAPVLGLMEDADFNEQQMVLKPGDSLFLYTDGITEAMNTDNQLFGGERILETLRAEAPSTNARLEGVMTAVRRFAGDAPQSDDITVMVLRYSAARHELHLRNRLEELGPALDRIEGLVLHGTSDRELAGDMRLIAEEGISNVIRHGYARDSEGNVSEGTIDVELEIGEEFVRFEMRDSGPPYNPLNRVDPDLTKPVEERTPGGLGVYLMRVLTDSQSYAREGPANVLVLTKRRHTLEGNSHNAEHRN
jgi:sigma-B regulation protein RsbU (phosphoserine phosphatase)